MRKLLFLLLLVLPAFGQTWSGRSSGDSFVLPPYRFCLGEDNGQSACFKQSANQTARLTGFLDFAYPSFIVSTLPPAALNRNRTYVVIDGTSNTDCTTGGASTTAFCLSNGISWVSIGGSSVSLQTNGSSNSNQGLLNLAAGAGTTISNSGGTTTITNTTSGGNVSTNANTGNQDIVQVASAGVSTRFSTNNFGLIRYVTPSWNWSYTDSGGSLGNLTSAGSNTITLPCSSGTPCPLGLDTASAANNYVYTVYISGTGTAEAALVTGGSCTSGATSSCTLIVTTVNTHANGYTVGSASTGVQEAWNDAWVSDTPSSPASVSAPYVKLMAGTKYDIYSAVYMRGFGGVLDGLGSVFYCHTRDRCLYIGDTKGGPGVTYHKVYGLTGTSSVNVAGSNVSSVSASSGTYTVTTAANHNFLAGDVVECEYYSTNTNLNQHVVKTVLSSGLTATQFQFSLGSATQSAGTYTFGFCELLNTFIEDNSDHATIQDLQLTQISGGGTGYFSNGVTNDNDQQLQIDRMTNRSSCVIRANACGGLGDTADPMGAMVFQRTDQSQNGITYLHDSEFTNVNCATAGNNGFKMSDSVCQGFPVYGVRYFGVLQGATFEDNYMEVSGAVGLLYNTAGVNGQMGYLVAGTPGASFKGPFPLSGQYPLFASGGGGGSALDYWVVAHSAAGTSPPMLVGVAQPASGSTNVTVIWPSVQPQGAGGAITYDILRIATPPTFGNGTPQAPFGTGNFVVPTGSGVSGSCGSNGMCSFVDTAAGSTSPNSYTVASGTWFPIFWFMPSTVTINNSTITADNFYGTGIIASQYTTTISVIAKHCFAAGPPLQTLRFTCFGTDSASNDAFWSFFLNGVNALGNNVKGRLNMGNGAGSPPYDLITLADSNLNKTFATIGNRALADAGDTAIGLDQSGGLVQRAGTSISSYINTVTDNASWLERLTSSGKTFATPVITQKLNGEIHSAAYPGDTFAQLLALCPAFPAPCRVILDPSSTPISINGNTGSPVVIGPGTGVGSWQWVTVENRGVVLRGDYTGGAPNVDAIQMGEWGSLICTNEGNTTNNGCTISTAANATYRSLISNAGVALATWAATTAFSANQTILPSSNNASNHYYTATTGGTTGGSQPNWSGGGCTSYTTGATCTDGSVTWTDEGTVWYLNYLQQRYVFEGHQLLPSGTSTIAQGIFSIIATEGFASFKHISILGIKNATNLFIADGPNSGDNNSLDFQDFANVCSNNAGCNPITVTTATNNGNPINLHFNMIGFGNGPGGSGCASGAGCMLNIDGSFLGNHNTGFAANIMFDGSYMENSGTFPAWTTGITYAAACSYYSRTPCVGNAILPPTSGHNNPSGHYYVITTAGTTGGSEPVWNGAGCTGYTQGSTCTDGSAVWTDQGATNPSHFIEITNGRDIDIRGFNINAGSVGTAVTLTDAGGSQLGRVHIMGRAPSGHCTVGLIKNNVTGTLYDSGCSAQDVDYLYPGHQTNGVGTFIDGDVTMAGLDQTVTKSFAGSCNMSTSTTCTFVLATTPPSTYLCFASIDHASSPPATANVASCSVSGTTVTITAGISNSLTWDALFIGNPN